MTASQRLTLSSRQKAEIIPRKDVPELLTFPWNVGKTQGRICGGHFPKQTQLGEPLGTDGYTAHFFE